MLGTTRAALSLVPNTPRQIEPRAISAGQLRLRHRRDELDVGEAELRGELLGRRPLLAVADQPEVAAVVGEQGRGAGDGLEAVQRDVGEIPEDRRVVAGVVGRDEPRFFGADPEHREVRPAAARESREEVGVLGCVDHDRAHAPTRQRVEGAGRERDRRTRAAAGPGRLTTVS